MGKIDKAIGGFIEIAVSDNTSDLRNHYLEKIREDFRYKELVEFHMYMLILCITLAPIASLKKLISVFNKTLDSLPFLSSEPEFIGFGGERIVYKVSICGNDYVIKVLKTSMYKEFDSIASSLREEMIFVAQIFSADLIEKEMMFYAPFPFEKVPSICIMQRFIGDMSDIFEYGDVPEFIDFLMSNGLASKFIKLVDSNEYLISQYGKSLDLVGYKNISFVKTESGFDLKIIDSGIITYYSGLSSIMQTNKAKFARRRNFMITVRDILNQNISEDY